MATQNNQQEAQSTAQQPVREREVIVTNGNGEDRSSNVAGVLVGLLAIVVVVVLGVLAFNALTGSSGNGSPVDVPSQVDVNVNPGGGSSGG